MKFWELARTANKNLLRAKLRTFLTVMAIFVGAFTLCMTNGVGDGLKSYVETQVKSVEGDRILFARKKFPQEMEEQMRSRGPVEYKETTQDDEGNTIDPNSMLVTLPQMDKLARDLPEVRSITPAFPIRAEYVTIEGGKKYQIGLGMLSEGIEQKLEAGKMFDGSDQIILAIHLARAFDENVGNLVGKQVTIAYKAGTEGEMRERKLKISGIATKGMIANLNSFVDAGTARSLYAEQFSEAPNYNVFQNFTVQLERSDEELLASTKERLDKLGFSGLFVAGGKRRFFPDDNRQRPRREDRPHLVVIAGHVVEGRESHHNGDAE